MEHRTTEQGNTGGIVKHSRNNGTLAEDWNTGRTIGILRNSEISEEQWNKEYKKTTPINITNTERRHNDQIT